jgi:hypothetical protein
MSNSIPILSDFDVQYILRAAEEAAADREKYGHVLYKSLMDIARSANLKNRFWEAVYHGRPTRFILTELPLRAKFNGTHISIEDVINDQSVLDRLEKSCGNHVEASYETDQCKHIIVYLEFVPPKKSILNPEDDVTIPTAFEPSEEIQNRRLEKETGW